MALFILLMFLLNATELFGSQDAPKITINPSSPHTMVFTVDSVLNLTCSIVSNVPEDVLLEWFIPIKTLNSQNKVDMVPGKNSLNVIVRNLQEQDSGDYKCVASSNTNPDLLMEKSARIKVKQKKNCDDMMFFRCPGEVCINKRFTCDGMKDCKNGEDENEALCGLQPCRNKLICDGRCIPYAWCCDPATHNCTGRTSLTCCPSTRDDSGFAQETQRYNDVAFFQTTVYTVIGCAMAFMFIVTILVIAICRVHMRRTMMPRCPAGNRAVNCRPGSHFNGLPFYDLDMLFNRPSDHMNPLLVTYNINNGVQFVGRPVDPPPYCEIVATPPREGPPPPYASNENIAIVRRVSKTDVPEQDDEARESDSLLTRNQPQPGISVISSNSIDTAEPNRSTFVVNLTDSEHGGSPMLTIVETQMAPSSSQPVASTSTTPTTAPESATNG